MHMCCIALLERSTSKAAAWSRGSCLRAGVGGAREGREGEPCAVLWAASRPLLLPPPAATPAAAAAAASVGGRRSPVEGSVGHAKASLSLRAVRHAVSRMPTTRSTALLPLRLLPPAESEAPPSPAETTGAAGTQVTRTRLEKQRMRSLPGGGRKRREGRERWSTGRAERRDAHLPYPDLYLYL